MPRPVLRPRKKPLQDRSRATVDAIVQAAAYILVKRGPGGLTTNAIAEHAGVNIASVYQFFPGKESIVAELRRRHVAEQRAAIAQACEGHEGKSTRELVRMLVNVGIAAHAVAPRLHHALTEMMPGRVDDDDATEKARFRGMLALTDVPDADVALWLIDTVSHAAIHRAAVERPELLKDPLFTDELVALVLGYLHRERPDASR